jgi:IMP dehydrogenase
MKERTARVEREGLTYDDVLLVPSYSEVMPREVDISSYFSRNIAVKIPIVTAAMDTVTESTMAIAIAREGGLGVIHKNMSIEKQAMEVRKVKRAEAGMILQPITVNVSARVADAINIMREHKIGGIPVVNDDLVLVGIITNRDLRFERNLRKSVSEVMTRKVITTEEFTDFETAAEILNQHKIEKLPVVDKQGHLIGLITYKDIIKLKSMPNACKDDNGRLRVAAAVGIASDTLERVNALVAEGVDAVVVDTAHGHSKAVLEMARQVKSAFPGIDLVVGNIATREAAEALLKLEVDAIKVGIGPGSICTTRVIAGIGVPQLTASMEGYDVIKNTAVPLIADGGIRFTGDIVKALAAGASTIMAGSLFAGVDESPGEAVIYEGRNIKLIEAWVGLKPCKRGGKIVIFRIWKTISRNWFPKV